ncbi:MAG: PLP-dependent aminotransferase family protein [Candidatus Pelagadaptatus aseana]|uniref:MocR-like pyridoxine biosynthesis transcription factor PdxR n=1 Tax=Candidatus Pelagadaptatus aseana TaxID=3120508 RepID=UPI0039B29714
MNKLMKEHLFYLEPKPGLSLQVQIKEMLVSAILDGHLAPGDPLPSNRKLAQTLKVSRNTVVFVYEKLLEEGYIVSRERQGHFVNPEVQSVILDVDAILSRSAEVTSTTRAADWESRFRIDPQPPAHIKMTKQWRHCRYSFIYGQLDPELFPVADWRECVRQASSNLLTRDWLGDSADADDPMLIEQLRSRVLPRRGIRCGSDEILVTLGTQQSLYMLAQLLASPGVRVGLENPGYADVRKNFELVNADIVPLSIDVEGVVVNQALESCDYVYVTPSHQAPTTVTMSMERRKALLQSAELHDQIIIEDDYENEINFHGHPAPALKSLDHGNRVIYVGSLSKTLSPGLRIGFMVGPAELINKARALRHLMLRHPPANNQRALALFLAGGYHDTLLRRLTQTYRERSECLMAALQQYLPEMVISESTGGSSLWVEGPEDLDLQALQERALRNSLFFEIGEPLFFDDSPKKNCFRLGYSSIKTEDIEPGIKLLAELIHCRH